MKKCQSYLQPNEKPSRHALMPQKFLLKVEDTQQWIYECLLMRIKNKKLYEHLRSHEILSLPHESTLNKYLKRMGSAYGFNPVTFHLLKKQSKQKEPAERRD